MNSLNSGELLKKNLKYLKKLRPEIARCVESAEEPGYSQVLTAKNGAPCMSFRVGEKTIAIHSKYDPQREAARWAASLDGEWDTLILYGLGLGYHALETVRTFPGRKVIIIEKNYGLVRQALCSVDLAELWANGTSILINEDPRAAADGAYQESEAAFSKKQIVKVLPPYELAFPDHALAFLQRYNDHLLQFRGNIQTRTYFKQNYLENLKHNAVKYLESPGVNQLFNKFQGVPIIIVASGPSLEKNIHLLPDFKNKAVIIAAGSAIGPLVRNNIIPDLLVSIDPGHNNYKHFTDINTESIRLIFNSTLYATIVEDYQGPTFSMGLDTAPYERWLEKCVGRDKGIIRSGASVVIPAFDLAVKMGGNPIIFVGQDLAYTNLKSHAEGRRWQRDISKEENGLFQVDGISGPVYTNRKFWVMKLHLEQVISSCAQTRRVINATEGGVLLENTESMDLAQVLVEFKNSHCPVQEVLDEEIKLATKLSEQDLELLAHAFAGLNEEVQLIGEAYHEVSKLAETMLKPGAKLKESKIGKWDKEIRRWENRVKRTELFEYFLEPLLREKLSIISKEAAKEIMAAQDIESKARAIAAGYSKWMLVLRDDALNVQRELIC